MKTTKILTLILALFLIVSQTSCTKDEDEKLSPYAEMHGTFTGDMAITGTKTMAGTTTVTMNVDGNNVRASFNYEGYNIDIELNVLEVQNDKDILYTFPQQNIEANGITVDIEGKELAAGVDGTFSSSNKQIAFAFTYSDGTDSLEFYFIGDMN